MRRIIWYKIWISTRRIFLLPVEIWRRRYEIIILEASPSQTPLINLASKKKKSFQNLEIGFPNLYLFNEVFLGPRCVPKKPKNFAWFSRFLFLFLTLWFTSSSSSTVDFQSLAISSPLSSRFCVRFFHPPKNTITEDTYILCQQQAVSQIALNIITNPPAFVDKLSLNHHALLLPPTSEGGEGSGRQWAQFFSTDLRVPVTTAVSFLFAKVAPHSTKSELPSGQGFRTRW